jgi:drug/metabolite transporter (DMT)-like permease
MIESSPQPKLHPYMGLAIGVIAVSAASIIVRLAQSVNVPSFVIAAYRLTIAALVVAPIALTRHRAELASLTRREYLLAALTGICLGLHFAAWFTSLEYTSVASSAVFVTTAPLFVALFSAVVWREKLGLWVVIGLLVSLLGGILIGVSDVCIPSASGLACPPLSEFIQGPAFLGDLLATLGAITFAANILIGSRLRAKLSLVPYIFLAYTAAAITLILAATINGDSFVGYTPVNGDSFVSYPPSAYFWMALLALVPQLIGHSSFNWALRYLPATFVTITTLGEPIGSTILALFIFQEVPTPLKLFGGILILGGILFASRRN